MGTWVDRHHRTAHCGLLLRVWLGFIALGFCQCSASKTVREPNASSTGEKVRTRSTQRVSTFERIVAFESAGSSFGLVHEGRAATLWVSPTDHPGVRRVARDLAADIERVTGVRPRVLETEQPPTTSEPLVVVGSLAGSAALRRLSHGGVFASSAIAGQWEASAIEVLHQPWTGAGDVLALVGSDPRGAIYAAYELSRQLGVSPWYYFDDVPSVHREQAYVRDGVYIRASPAVKYRGFFINDEAPALASWAAHTFGPAPNSQHPHGFNQALYAHVFEVLLRLRGNYLWPAVWGRSLFDDDPRNQQLAAEYGVVMGTSHEAPMMRAQDEWNRYGGKDGPYGGSGAFSFVRNEAALKPYWEDGIRRAKDYESLVTVGMRGNGDVGMEDAQGIELMGRIVASQRAILERVKGKPASTIPQVWTLYKEVQRYWEEGMRAPDDVTIIWCDDNWGNLRGLPDAQTARRSGGNGIYYHFDYVGGGRNYKWLDTVNLASTWEQLHLAHQKGADRVWMVNVGDLKNVEQPLQFFLDYAWAPSALPIAQLPTWEVAWAKEQFGEAHAAEVADVLRRYHGLQSRRKPELLNRLIELDAAYSLSDAPGHAVVYRDDSPFSLTNYREAERVTAEWQTLLERSTELRTALPKAWDDAYFELVHYAVEATANMYALRLNQFLNRLYVKQGRSSANAYASRARDYLARDEALSHYYNEGLANGKWRGFQSQAKLGYGGPYPNSSWQQPERNDHAIPDFIWPELQTPAPRKGVDFGVAVSDSEAFYPEQASLTLPEFSPYQTAPQQAIELFNRGGEPFEFTLTPAADYVQVSAGHGRVETETRVEVRVDFERAPYGRSQVPVRVEGPRGRSLEVQVPVFRPQLDGRVLAGIVESQGVISIAAENYQRNITSNAVSWTLLPGVGRSGAGMTPFPATAERQAPERGSARLEYDIETFSAGKVTIWAYLSPRLPVFGTDGLKYAISIDDQPVQVVNVTTQQSSLPDGRGWERNTSDNVNRSSSEHTLGAPGRHTLKFWMVDPTVVLQQLVVDTGGLKSSYLGPPVSLRLPGGLPIN